MTKKTMTMKRITETGEAEELVTNEIISGISSDELQTVQSYAGITVVGDLEPELEEIGPAEIKLQEMNTKQTINNGVVTSSPEMEEVSYDDFSKSNSSDLGSDSASSTKMVKDLIGKSVEFATELLTKMKTEGKVSSFRIVPIGMPMTMDFQPGRVSALKDTNGNIVDVEIS